MCREPAKAFSNFGKISLIPLWFILTLAAAGCSPSPRAPQAATPFPKENTREYVHKNGLTVRLPENFSVAEEPEGFIVETADGSNKSARYPTSVLVILKKDEKPSAGGYARQKTIGSRTIKYSIDKNEGGGSGGAEYNLSAYESTAKGYFHYSQTVQSEDSEPQFNLLWTIVENTSLKN